MSAKKVTKKKKKAAATKKVKAAAKPKLPRKQDVPGYSTGVPDLAKWPEVARVLKVRPFYKGPGSVPFSRLRAHLVPDGAAGNAMKNDFYLASD